MFKKYLFSLLAVTLVFHNALGMQKKDSPKKKFLFFLKFKKYCQKEDPIARELDSMQECISFYTREDLKQLITKHEKNINAPILGNGQTLLHLAVFNGYCDLVSSLLYTSGINPNIRDFNGLTPIFIALLKNNKDIIDIMVNKVIQITPKQLDADYKEIEGNLNSAERDALEDGIEFIKDEYFKNSTTCE